MTSSAVGPLNSVWKNDDNNRFVSNVCEVRLLLLQRRTFRIQEGSALEVIAFAYIMKAFVNIILRVRESLANATQ